MTLYMSKDQRKLDFSIHDSFNITLIFVQCLSCYYPDCLVCCSRLLLVEALGLVNTQLI